MRMEFDQDGIKMKKMTMMRFGGITTRELLTESSVTFLSNIFLSEEKQKVVTFKRSSGP